MAPEEPEPQTISYLKGQEVPRWAGASRTQNVLIKAVVESAHTWPNSGWRGQAPVACEVSRPLTTLPSLPSLPHGDLQCTDDHALRSQEMCVLQPFTS